MNALYDDIMNAVIFPNLPNVLFDVDCLSAYLYTVDGY
jgi:hypothetical protein